MRKMSNYQIINQTKYCPDEKKIQILINEMKLKLPLSIVLVNEEDMLKFNAKYRNKKKVTDVLSFIGDETYLGDIIICPDYFDGDFEELKLMIVHGILHLQGHDHYKKVDIRKMENLEKKYLGIK